MYVLILQKRVIVALEDAGVFTSGGLVKDKVCEYAPNQRIRNFYSS